MRFALLLAVGVAVTAAGAGVPGLARACSIVAFELERGAEQADVIAFGRLIDADRLTARFEVDYSFGGEALPPVLSIDNRFMTPSADCSKSYDDRPRYTNGLYLAFLEHIGDNVYDAIWFGQGMVLVDGQRLEPWWLDYGRDESALTLAQTFDEARAWLSDHVGQPVSPEQSAKEEGNRSRAWLVLPVLLAAGAITAGFALRRIRRSGAR